MTYVVYRYLLGARWRQLGMVFSYLRPSFISLISNVDILFQYFICRFVVHSL